MKKNIVVALSLVFIVGCSGVSNTELFDPVYSVTDAETNCTQDDAGSNNELDAADADVDSSHAYLPTKYVTPVRQGF
jgi:PBP1b-binding outer membrane lipoprotein LpoB